LKKSVNFENYENLVRRATESGMITEEQATSVRLAQQASASVIAVDDFTREEVDGLADPAMISEETELVESSETDSAE